MTTMNRNLAENEFAGVIAVAAEAAAQKMRNIATVLMKVDDDL